LDLAGNTGEEDPCEESRLEISIGATLLPSKKEKDTRNKVI